MKAIGKEIIASASKKNSEKDQSEQEDESEDHMKIVEFMVNNRADEKSVRHGTVISICVFNVNDYPPPDLLFEV